MRIDSLTPTQQRIFDLLSDGKHHTYDELAECLWDENSLTPRETLRVHLHNLRKRLTPNGMEIVCRSYPTVLQTDYRLARRMRRR